MRHHLSISLLLALLVLPAFIACKGGSNTETPAAEAAAAEPAAEATDDEPIFEAGFESGDAETWSGDAEDEDDTKTEEAGETGEVPGETTAEPSSSEG